MRNVALAVTLVIAVFEIFGIANPHAILEIAEFIRYPVGLYVVAAITAGFGLLLIGAAGTSRMPRTLRILGAAFILGGISLPFFGVEGIWAILDWWSTQGVAFMRTWMAFELLFYLFIVFALTPHRNPTLSPA